MNTIQNKKLTLAQLREKRQKIAETFGTRSREYYAVQKQISRRLAKWKETKQIKPGSNLWKGVLAQKQRKLARETSEKKLSLKQWRVKRGKIAKSKGVSSKEYKSISRIISRRLKRWKETKQIKPGSNLWKGVLAQKRKKEERLKREKGTLIAIKTKIKKTDYRKKLKTLFTKYKEQFFKEYGTIDIQKAIKRDQEKHSKNWSLDKFWQRLFKKYWKQKRQKSKKGKKEIICGGIRIDGEGRVKPKYCPECGELLGTNSGCETCETNQGRDYES